MNACDEISNGTDLIEHPETDLEIRRKVDEILTHYYESAVKAVKRMRQIPKSQRPQWYENNIRYWINVSKGLKWVMRSNQEIIRYATLKSQRSTEAPDTPIPSGGDS